MDRGVDLLVEMVGYMTGLSGAREIVLRLPTGSTVGSALRELVSRVPRAGITLTPSDGKVSGCLLVLNERHLRFPDDLDVEIGNGDRMAVIPPVAGGRSDERGLC